MICCWQIPNDSYSSRCYLAGTHELADCLLQSLSGKLSCLGRTFPAPPPIPCSQGTDWIFIAQLSCTWFPSTFLWCFSGSFRLKLIQAPPVWTHVYSSKLSYSYWCELLLTSEGGSGLLVNYGLWCTKGIKEFVSYAQNIIHLTNWLSRKPRAKYMISN